MNNIIIFILFIKNKIKKRFAQIKWGDMNEKKNL